MSTNAHPITTVDTTALRDHCLPSAMPLNVCAAITQLLGEATTESFSIQYVTRRDIQYQTVDPISPVTSVAAVRKVRMYNVHRIASITLNRAGHAFINTTFRSPLDLNDAGNALY